MDNWALLTCRAHWLARISQRSGTVSIKMRRADMAHRRWSCASKLGTRVTRSESCPRIQTSSMEGSSLAPECNQEPWLISTAPPARPRAARRPRPIQGWPISKTGKHLGGCRWPLRMVSILNSISTFFRQLPVFKWTEQEGPESLFDPEPPECWVTWCSRWDWRLRKISPGWWE